VLFRSLFFPSQVELSLAESIETNLHGVQQ
jgi:hypothetical protein